MTTIGQAHIKVVVDQEDTIVTLLKEILATLQRIEAQGKPQAFTNVFVTKDAAGNLDEDSVARAASNALYRRIASEGGVYKRAQSNAEAEKLVADTFIAQVEDAPAGVPVNIGDCGGCEACGCDD